MTRSVAVVDPRISAHDPLGAILDRLARLIPAWHADALCAQVDGDLFFPDKGESTREAKAICRQCPVRAECLLWALDNAEPYGIWGGLSERDRRRLRRGSPFLDRTCVVCGEDFEPRSESARTCGPVCRSELSSRIARRELAG